MIRVQRDLPTLAADPPMIRLFCTFENPQPSSGVNRRPLTFATGIDGFCDPPNIENRANNCIKSIVLLQPTFYK